MEHYITAYRVEEDEAEPPLVTLVDGDSYWIGEFAPRDFVSNIDFCRSGQVYRELSRGEYQYYYRTE